MSKLRGRRGQLEDLRRALDRYEELLDRRAEFMPPHEAAVGQECRHCTSVRRIDDDLAFAASSLGEALKRMTTEVNCEERRVAGIPAKEAVG